MTFKVRLTTPPLLRTAVALAIAVSSAAAFAANPSFTFNPVGAGLVGTAFTADNILISDYSKVTVASTGSFTDTGYLVVTGFQSGTNPDVVAAGLNSTYGLYFQFNGTGTTTAGNPLTTATSGSFNTLTYSLFGYNGAGNFGVDASNNPFATTGATTLLATGALSATGGNYVSTNPNGGTSFFAGAGANLNFNVNAANSAFFSSPNPFYNLAMTSFTNTPSTVSAFSGGFNIIKGGGTINFAPLTPVPEPETYALMLAGLGAVGFVARRRRSV